ncbi:hypothetical protein [Dactylosporangium darangshiense]|uniref:hypothetical protein n=1 Tax=Dactylosporangium darangshiense TaxID=579108 RepID=UPI0031EBBCAE
MSVLRAAAVDVIGGVVVLVGLALIVHESGVLASAVRRTGRRGATTVEALRASAANDGRCLLVGRLRDASDPPTPPRSGRRVAWYRRQHTREYEDTTGEFPVVRSFTVAVDTGPGSIALDDGTGLALVPPRLIHPDRWGPVTVKSPDLREWTIRALGAAAFAAVVVRGADVRRGGVAAAGGAVQCARGDLRDARPAAAGHDRGRCAGGGVRRQPPQVPDGRREGGRHRRRLRTAALRRSRCAPLVR